MTLALDNPTREANVAGAKVRIRPVPRSEPRTDEERRHPAVDVPAPAAVQSPNLATGVRVRRNLRQRGADPGRDRAGTPEALIGQGRPAGRHAPTPTPAASIATPHAPTADAAEPSPASRELHLAARRLLAACVEVLGGFRPVGQLRLTWHRNGSTRSSIGCCGRAPDSAGVRPPTVHPWWRWVPARADRLARRPVTGSRFATCSCATCSMASPRSPW